MCEGKQNVYLQYQKGKTEFNIQITTKKYNYEKV